MRKILFSVISIWLVACGGDPGEQPLTEAEKHAIVQENHEYRGSREKFFRESQYSPFVRDTTIEFGTIHWYPVDPMYRGSSVLHRYENPEMVNIFGTGGEVRKQVRYGYFEITVPDSSGKNTRIRLNAYKVTPEDPLQYARLRNELSVWFTDETTGFETYGVGRYVDVGSEHPDPHHMYLIDLNKAYNPYCAYSDFYSCAIPSEEDHIAVPIRAGEKNYHTE